MVFIHKFGVVQAQRTSSNPLKTHDIRESEALSHKVEVVQAPQTSSNPFNTHALREREVCRVLSHKFGVVFCAASRIFRSLSFLPSCHHISLSSSRSFLLISSLLSASPLCCLIHAGLKYVHALYPYSNHLSTTTHMLSVVSSELQNNNCGHREVCLTLQCYYNYYTYTLCMGTVISGG